MLYQRREATRGLWRGSAGGQGQSAGNHQNYARHKVLERHYTVSLMLLSLKSTSYILIYDSIKTHLEPLAVAANMLQAADTRLDTTILTWGNLYRIYSDPMLDSAVSSQVLSSLSERWSQMDQDAFISAVVMNPYIRSKCFARGNPQLAPIGLYNIVKRTFCRMLRTEPDLDFYSAFFDYLIDSREFSSSWMGLTEFKQSYDNEVISFLFSFSPYRNLLYPRMQMSTLYCSGNDSTQVFHMDAMHSFVSRLVFSVLSPIVRAVNEPLVNSEPFTRNSTTACRKRRLIRLRLLKWTKLVPVCSRCGRSAVFRILSH